MLPWIETHKQEVFEQKEGVCSKFSFDTEMSVRAVHVMTEVSDSTYVVKRTLEGRQITSIDAESTVSLGR